MQKEIDKIMEIANNIQSFPSISAFSTSIGKYSGIGMGSIKSRKFNFIFQFKENGKDKEKEEIKK